MLHAAGFDLSSADIVVERREDRWLIRLPEGRLAWFAANPAGAGQLRRERRVLRLLATRCGFHAPRLLFESGQGWDVRAAVPGSVEPQRLYVRLQADRALGASLGRAVGAMLADQHLHVRAEDVGDWLPRRPAWPEPSIRVKADLPEIVDDPGLLRELDAVLDTYDAVDVATADRVLVHGDLGLHNLAIDAATDEVKGVFDYGDACWADRHHDFRYLLLGADREDMLESALAAYEQATGRSLNRSRLRLYNAACAIGFLAYRKGVPADCVWCGRTLAEDLAWIAAALRRL